MNDLPQAACCSSNLPHFYPKLPGWNLGPVIRYSWICFNSIHCALECGNQLLPFRRNCRVMSHLFSPRHPLSQNQNSRAFLRRLFNLHLSLHVIASNEQTKSALQISLLIANFISCLHGICQEFSSNFHGVRNISHVFPYEV